MSREVGMEDKLLNQVSCRVKQDILKKKENTTAVLSSANSGQVTADKGRVTPPQLLI